MLSSIILVCFACDESKPDSLIYDDEETNSMMDENKVDFIYKKDFDDRSVTRDDFLDSE